MNIMSFTLRITILGILSSGLGGFLGGIIKPKNKDILSSMYQITGGIMTGIVCFDMLPESFSMSNVFYGILGVIIGIILVYNLDIEASKFEVKNSNKKYTSTTIVVLLSMALHNILEGLAIGASMMYSTSLGISVLVSMLLHDIPEGAIVGISEYSSKSNIKRKTIDSMIVGMSVGIGVFIGQVFGTLSDTLIAMCLSIAAGAMLYISSCDLIPSSVKITTNKLTYLMYAIGILIGALIVYM